MNTYYLEVIGSQWPRREVNADRFEIGRNNISFYRMSTVVASYPTERTIIYEIEYNTNEI